MRAYVLNSGTCILYIDHASEAFSDCDNAKNENVVKESNKFGDCDGDKDVVSERQGNEGNGSETDGSDSEWIESGEDDSEEDYSDCNDSDSDEEFLEIREKRKHTFEAKKNPMTRENDTVDNDFNVPLKNLVKGKDKAKKKKIELDMSKIGDDWESDHDSDSFRIR